MSARSTLASAAGSDARLAAYAALAGVALAAPAAAKADIIWNSTANINIPSTTAGVYINLVTGVTGTNPAAVPGWDINPVGHHQPQYLGQQLCQHPERRHHRLLRWQFCHVDR